MKYIYIQNFFEHIYKLWNFFYLFDKFFHCNSSPPSPPKKKSQNLSEIKQNSNKNQSANINALPRINVSWKKELLHLMLKIIV